MTSGAVRDELERRLICFVNEQLVGGGDSVSVDTLLFEQGYLNSLRILDLLAFVERVLGQKIPDHAVRLANFRSVRAISRAFLDGHAEHEPARLFEHQADRGGFASPVEALCARGDLTLLGPGRVALGGTALTLRRFFDAAAMRWARELGAHEHEFPSLIPLETLERAGYVASFPHLLTLAGHLEPSLELLRRVGERPDSLVRDDLAPPRYALGPAVCYHCYPLWAGRTLDGATVLSARSRCYRNEADEAPPLERLWDFTMREIVVLGTRTEVEATREALVRRAGELVVSLGLDGRIETASDPFFTRIADGKHAFQRAGALKYELGLTVDASGRTVAAASFNHHRDHFGRRFDIRLANGTAAHTGCVALGLERWVLAFFAQHGLDERAWPEEVRAWCDTEIACDQPA
jgi:acyl carrier protein